MLFCIVLVAITSFCFAKTFDAEEVMTTLEILQVQITSYCLRIDVYYLLDSNFFFLLFL